MALTKVTGPGIVTTTNLRVGILTADNISVGGTITYEDVTEINAVGVVTAQGGLHVGVGGTIIHALRGAHNGKVGIGTTNPGRALTIRHSEPRIRLIDHDTGSFSEVYTDNSGHLYLSADAGQANGGSRILFNIDGGEKGRINNDGFVSLAGGVAIGATLSVAGVSTFRSGEVVVGNFVPVDTRNTGGLHIQAARGISFKAHSTSTSRNWRIRNDDWAWGNLDFTSGTSNSDWSDAVHEVTLSLTKDKNVGINTSVPTSKFDVHMNEKAGINFTNSGNNAVLDFRSNMVESAGRIRVDESSNGGYLDVYTKNTSGTLLKRISVTNDGDVEFVGPTAGVSSCTWDRSASVLNFKDSVKTTWGTGGDLFIQHTSSGSGSDTIDSSAGYLYINTDALRLNSNTSGWNYLRADKSDGVLKLYKSNSEKLATSDTGITVTGEVGSSQDYPKDRPKLDLNFAGTKKLDSRITYTRSGSASYVDEFGYVKVVGPSFPRFDHDPITGESKGLLIEESRTNINRSSTRQWLMTGWNQSRHGYEQYTSVTAPDGSTNAMLSYPNTGDNGSHYTYINSAGAGLTGKRTISGWFKNLGTTIYYPQLRTFGRGNGVAHATFVLTGDGTVSSSGSATTGATITKYPNGWYRCTLSWDDSTGHYGGGWVIGNHTSNELPSYVADSNKLKGFLVWGFQSEVGAFSTSYIPTSGNENDAAAAIATRGADQVTISGSEFTDFYNDDEGTFAVSHSILPDVPDAENCYVFEVSDGGSTHVAFRYNDVNTNFANKPSFHSVYSSGLSASMNASGSYTRGQIVKGAMTAKSSSFKATWNGETIQTDGSGSFFGPGSTGQLAIGRYHPTASHELNGHIQRMMYWPKQLSSNQLVNLTS